MRANQNSSQELGDHNALAELDQDREEQNENHSNLGKAQRENGQHTHKV
jgi:hypothetical protein